MHLFMKEEDASSKTRLEETAEAAPAGEGPEISEEEEEAPDDSPPGAPDAATGEAGSDEEDSTRG